MAKPRRRREFSDEWRFIEEQALKLGFSVDASRQWRRRGRVAYKHRVKFLRAGEKLGLDLVPYFDNPPRWHERNPGPRPKS
jgi:hypothetical protein